MAKSQHFSIAQWFFLLVCVFLIYLYWQVIEPFAFALITAGIFAIVLAPVHAKLTERFKWPRLNALLMILGVFVVILVPLFILGVLIVKEAQDVLAWSLNGVTWLQNFDISSNPLFVSLPAAVQDQILNIDFIAAGESVADWVFNRLGNALSGSVAMIFNTGIFFLGLYYFLVDRKRIYKLLLDLSPFKDSLDANIIKRIASTVRAVVFGALIVAFVQAVLATIGLTIFGVPGALFWGALVIITAQIPSIGVGIIMIPAIIYLAVTGHIQSAIGLTVWSVVVVGLIDNLLTPYILGSRTKMPELLILISVLGGIAAFGPIGFILGPTILAAIMVMIDLYRAGILENSNKC